MFLAPPSDVSLEECAAIDLQKAIEFRAIANNFDGYIAEKLHEIADAYEKRSHDTLTTLSDRRQS